MNTAGNGFSGAAGSLSTEGGQAGVSSAQGGSANVAGTAAGGANVAGTAAGGANVAGAAAGGGAGTSSSLEGACDSPSADPCADCVCMSCRDQLRQCDETSGCNAIIQCVFESECEGIACYCGSIDALRCAAGDADGPCKDAILSAPGGRPPTLVDPSGGPAGAAAAQIGACMEPPNGPCATACQAQPSL